MVDRDTHPHGPPTLVVFSGLPGSGKSTIAREVAAAIGAVHLRIDTIEQTLRDGWLAAGDLGPAGYEIGYAIAADNLRLGLSVVADSVNPLGITRDAWRAAAQSVPARCIDVHVVCSDIAEHRRRVESRQSDIEGLVLPSWEEVVAREFEPWDLSCSEIDTSGRAVEDNVRQVLDRFR